MQTKHVALKDLGKVISQDLATLRKRVIHAAERTAEVGADVAKANAPEAFGELGDGIYDEGLPAGARVRSSAPHSAAVEEGSRPHMPPLEPILAWVRLRGMQGLDPARPARGPHRFVARAIASRGNGQSTPVDAARRVAVAVQRKIAREGTAPTWFMQYTFTQIQPLLDAFIHRELEKPL